jgi:hypothetical protein
MNLLKKIYRGAGHLEGFGTHPGNQLITMFIVITGAAGAQHGGWWGFVGGAAFAAASVLPFWAIGCVSRYNSYLRDQQRMFNILSKK